MTRILSVEVDGLCGVRERVAFAPVTVFTGPNGSGKSTIVGAVAYALTGRFPRLVGVTAEALSALASDHDGFLVTVEAETKAGVAIRVERGLQKGKRKLAVSIDGRTIRAVRDGEALLRNHFGDVDWFVDMFDAERTFWRMSAEKRSRWMFELCAGASGWTKERVAAAVVGHVKDTGTPSDWNVHVGRDAASNMEINLQQLDERLLAAQRVHREAMSIAGGLAPPAGAPSPEELHDADEELRLSAEAASEARRAEAHHVAERAKLDEDIANASQELLQAEILSDLAPKQCPTCGQSLGARNAETVQKDLAKKAEAAEATLRSLQKQSAELPPKAEVLATVHAAASARYSAAVARVTALRQQEGIARERDGQTASAVGAEARAAELKKLLEAARVVRRQMLRDSIAPLRNALDLLTHLAPPSWAWDVDSDGTFSIVRPWDRAATKIPVDAMSAGEKYRATIALLVATSMLRREAWVGLFLDAFEQVSSDVRDDILLSLRSVVAQGHVDNVFVAGTFEPTLVEPNLKYAVREGRLAYHARTMPVTQLPAEREAP